MHPDEAVYKVADGLVIAWMPLWMWKFILGGAALPLFVMVPTTALGFLLWLVFGAALGLVVALYIARQFHGPVDFQRRLRWLFAQGKYYHPAPDFQCHPLEVKDVNPHQLGTLGSEN